jgi:hypothetical protein
VSPRIHDLALADHLDLVGGERALSLPCPDVAAEHQTRPPVVALERRRDEVDGSVAVNIGDMPDGWLRGAGSIVDSTRPSAVSFEP